MSLESEIKNLKLPPLKRGAHPSPEAGMCAMEMVAFLERLPHSDAPGCTCPVIAAYVRGINDMLPDGERNRLLPYLPRLVGTVAPQHQHARAEYLAWRAVRVFAPIALRAVGVHDHAAKLEAQTDLREAANTAARAANAAADAAYAADAASTEIYDAALKALDGVLEIGAVTPRAWPREQVAKLEQLSTITA